MAGTRPTDFGLETTQLHFAVSVLAVRKGMSRTQQYTIFNGRLSEVTLTEGGTFQSIAHLGIEGPDIDLLSALRVGVFCADDWTFTLPQKWSYLAHINELTEEGTITYWCAQQRARAQSARSSRQRDMASI
jgi:hypothetical protein